VTTPPESPTSENLLNPYYVCDSIQALDDTTYHHLSITGKIGGTVPHFSIVGD